MNEPLVREFIDRRESILIRGNGGANKTLLPIAKASCAWLQGRWVYFSGFTRLIAELLENTEDRSLTRFHGQLERPHRLAWDEMAYVLFSKAGGE